MVTVVRATVVIAASIATALFNHDIGTGQNAVAKNLLPHGREIRPIAGRRRRALWNNAGNDLVSLPEFYNLAGTQPSLQPLGVSKLANVHAGHNQIVPQVVTHCQAWFYCKLSAES
jgi:hypothetical protein